ncbi:MAG: ORF6N domain-containing protein [Candidatus Omnitrophica bacterium]|nr:ORF6N domain-containing protein [Candidatus Omnitrophota bacterium]
MKAIVPLEVIEQKIFLIRGQKVMLDRDLARLYGVETKYLKRQVRRNIDRFPSDFMFELSGEEFKNWRCQFGTSNPADKMGLRHSPYVFTEHGILMLSSILNSEKAIGVNIVIMRVFVKLREMVLTNKDFALRLQKLEHTVEEQGKQIHAIFEIVRKVMTVEEKPKRRIGFHAEEH